MTQLWQFHAEREGMLRFAIRHSFDFATLDQTWITKWFDPRRSDRAALPGFDKMDDAVHCTVSSRADCMFGFEPR
jgi:hypothetical protein